MPCFPDTATNSMNPAVPTTPPHSWRAPAPRSGSSQTSESAASIACRVGVRVPRVPDQGSEQFFVGSRAGRVEREDVDPAEVGTVHPGTTRSAARCTGGRLRRRWMLSPSPAADRRTAAIRSSKRGPPQSEAGGQQEGTEEDVEDHEQHVEVGTTQTHDGRRDEEQSRHDCGCAQHLRAHDVHLPNLLLPRAEGSTAAVRRGAARRLTRRRVPPEGLAGPRSAGRASAGRRARAPP